MIDFKEITLQDKELIQNYTFASGHRNCDLSFANLCSWAFLYHTRFAVVGGFLVFRFYVDNRLVYMMPIGKGNLPEVMTALKNDADEQGVSFRMLGVSACMKNELEQTMPGVFAFTADRDYSDYIYLRTDLAALVGKKYQPKRNHLNKFKKAYPNYEYKELTPELISECLKLEEVWCRSNGCSEERALSAERHSMTYAMTHMEALGITGGVLYVEGQIVAFTYGAPINEDTWDICVEKANVEVEGSYAAINNEYVNHISPTYVYINREEDLGLEGLRKAKLSYQPHCLLEKYIVELA